MIQKQVTDALAEKLLDGELVTGDAVRLDVSKDGESLKVEKESRAEKAS